MTRWPQIAREYAQYLLTTGRSKATAKTYCSNLGIFYRWCAEHECQPAEVPRAAIRDWLAERRECVSSIRVYNDLAALRVFYAYVRECGWREDDPTEAINVKRTRSLPTEPLAGGELRALLDSCSDDRDRLIIFMLAATGLRISELAALEADDIDWRRGVIRIHGKGDKERRIAPAPAVLAELRDYLGVAAHGPIWFSKRRHRPLTAHQIRKVIYTLTVKAGLTGIHPHRFRAYFATEYIEQFKDIQALQGVLGHESIETTARYSEYTRERRGLEQMKRFRI